MCHLMACLIYGASVILSYKCGDTKLWKRGNKKHDKKEHTLFDIIEVVIYFILHLQ